MGCPKQILVVEDEFLIAIYVAHIMTDLGFGVIGPVGDIHQALGLAAERALDGAILDVNLSGQLVFPVAATLASRGVPFILTSGYDANGLPVEWQGHPLLRKPVVERDLSGLARSVFLAGDGSRELKVSGVRQV
ncbi:response regulator [Niveispirillum lacus]|uniref:response regulator n=1 Tax=Niveispirillum lacus TaxID=1981099 RepID=UPI0010543C0B|nr:response regulator [Niveispirillum lacus]